MAATGQVTLPPTLAVLFGRFVALGVCAFGGPLAHLSMLTAEAERRGWATRRDVLEHMALASTMPGPNSTQAAILVGRQVRGFWGGLAAGAGFVAPGAVLVGLLSWWYLGPEGLSAWEDLTRWVQPVVVAIVAVALARFARSSLTSVPAVGGAVVGMALVGAGFSAPLAILGGGAVGAVVALRRPDRDAVVAVGALLLLPVLGVLARSTMSVQVLGAGADDVGLLALAIAFLQVAVSAFGSGYVLVTYLQWALVDQSGLLTSEAIAGAVALSHLAPGPLFTAATAAGVAVAGPAGGVVATLAVFAPSFTLVPWLAERVGRALSRPSVRAIRDSLIGGAFGAIAIAGVSLAARLLPDQTAWVVCAAAITALVRLELPPVAALAAAFVVTALLQFTTGLVG